MANTKIEWTNKSWNPVSGCTKVSQGCKNCYAETIANRFWGERDFTEIRLHPEKLEEPLHWRKPSMIFVNSMSDLFHPKVPFDFIFSVYLVMEKCPQHTFQILTKRPERALQFYKFTVDKDISSMKNIWLGVSVEDQQTADERIPQLLQIPAAVRFISAEPLLGAIDFNQVDRSDNAYFQWRGEKGCLPDKNEPDDYVYWCKKGIDWIIVGGESGYNARPMHPDWVRSIRDQCKEAGVPFFFKQWGEWIPFEDYCNKEIYYHKRFRVTKDSKYVMVGKRLAGNFLDGKQYLEYPENKLSGEKLNAG